MDAVGKGVRHNVEDTEFIVKLLAAWSNTTRAALGERFHDVDNLVFNFCFTLADDENVAFVEPSLQFMMHICKRHWWLVLQYEHIEQPIVCGGSQTDDRRHGAMSP